MSEILTIDDLRRITGNRKSASCAQVISDLAKMNMKFKINPKGYPISSMTAYERYLGVNRSKQHASDQSESQTGFEVLSSKDNG